MSKYKKRLFLDMDGVIVDFEKGILKYSNAFNHLIPGTKECSDEVDRVCITVNRHIFRELEPIEGAVEAYHTLCEHYDVRILSTPMWDLPESYTDKRIWVDKHLGPKVYKTLILTHDKGIVEGNYLIDDRLKNGSEKFKGLHIHFGTSLFPNWAETLKFLSQIDNW